MNNRYLYRAKRKDNGEWVIGNLLLDIEKEKPFETFRIYPVDYVDICRIVNPSTICQCSGVYDKNKKTIFEKDILNDEDGSIGIVEYGMYAHYHIGFFVRWLNKEADYYRNELGYWADKVECIGSAIDNPELLEVGE